MWNTRHTSAIHSASQRGAGPSWPSPGCCPQARWPHCPAACPGGVRLGEWSAQARHLPPPGVRAPGTGSNRREAQSSEVRACLLWPRPHLCACPHWGPEVRTEVTGLQVVLGRPPFLSVGLPQSCTRQQLGGPRAKRATWWHPQRPPEKGPSRKGCQCHRQ